MSERNAENAKPEDGQEGSSEREKLVSLIGMMINNTLHSYWLSSSDTENAVDECYGELEKVFAASGGDIEISIMNHGVLVCGEAVNSEDHLVRVFVEQLERLQINDFVIKNGMPLEEFGKLVEILSAQPVEMEELGGFSKVLSDFDMEHVRYVSVKYERIAEGDMVVSKDRTGGLTEEEISQKILAHLRGEETGEADAEALLRETSSDPGKVAGILVEASGDEGEDAESLVSNLQKTFDAMMNDPSAKTPTGKKKLVRMLDKIEKEVLGKLEGEGSGRRGKAVSEAVAVMRDELKMDALAAEYMKKRKAIEESEKRILRYIKAKGIDKIADTELEQKLGEAGLATNDWEGLVARSGAAGSGPGGPAGQASGGTAGAGFGNAVAGGPGGAGTGSGAGFTSLSMSQLSALLDHLETQIREVERDETDDAQGKGEADISNTVSEVRHQVDGMVEDTRRRIGSLVSEAMAGDDETGAGGVAGKSKDATGAGMTKRRMLRILAEIVQELFQPLSVVNCSIDMITSKALGEVADAQADMLKLARESAGKIQILVDELNRISGVPDSRTPDAEMIRGFYEK